MPYLSVRKLPLLLLLLGFLLHAFAFPTPSSAQETPGDTTESLQEATEATWPEDSLGRRTPKGTVDGFIEAVADENYPRAALYLNLDSTLQESQKGPELAQALQRMLDQRGRIMPLSWLSDDPNGYLEDDTGPNLDRVGTATVEGESFDVFVEKTAGPDGGPIWLFSSQTVKRTPLLEEEAAPPITDKVLPSVLEENKWGGVPIGHWLAMLASAVLAYLIAWCITAVVTYLIRLGWRKAREEPTLGIVKAFALPIRLYLAVWILVILSQEAGISIIVRQRFSELTVIIGLVAVLLLIWRLIDAVTNFSERRLIRRGNMAGISIALFLRRGAKIALIVLGTIAILGTLGFDVTTGLAALGIGGIALALGAQKTVENFVGSVTLIADQPIRVGDFCKVGETVGTVEQIGMRSTRIRTSERTIVTIPNGDFSSQRIENYAHRDRFLFNPVLRLKYDTTPDQIRSLLVTLCSILVSQPKVAEDPRVRFIEIGNDSLNLEVFTYILADDFNEFLQLKEELILQMMEAVHKGGKGFALPSQVLYLAGDKGGDGDKSPPAEGA
ncbi:mechanosensitive ion channel protein MscS [Pontibacter flavimaris]|uniref:Mechanosensitive ion channel protein MscS n=1 Tax=Pontibacter flavimaris TaxID=1797110 RepID=A0A1Q5P9D9_9BACT|nr:mechanosensitive ion channel protein MscS [Pontibacter flavimaris]